MELIIQWVTQYGYIAIFALLVTGIVGLPIPEETMLVFSGYLISQGHLHPLTTLAVAFAGSMCGITCSYMIGRTLGLGFVHKWGRYAGLNDSKLDSVHKWFNRVGHWALFIGYYIAGVRHFTAIIAGTSSLEYRSFAMYAYSGALVWVSVFLSLGYYFGEHWKEVSEMAHRHLLKVSLVLLVAGAIYGLYWWRKRKAAESQRLSGTE